MSSIARRRIQGEARAKTLVRTSATNPKTSGRRCFRRYGQSRASSRMVVSPLPGPIDDKTAAPQSATPHNEEEPTGEAEPPKNEAACQCGRACLGALKTEKHSI